MDRSAVTAIIVVLVVFLVGGFLYWNMEPPPPDNGVEELAFNAEGNIVRNNPGLKPDRWYLVHETPGNPALAQELVFDAGSRCTSGSATSSCSTFTQGERVRIEGTDRGGVVTVRTLARLTAPELEQGRTVRLFFYDPNRDKDQTGNILCSEKGLVAVERVIPRTMTPVQDAVKLLLRGELSPDERQRGITTEFPLPGVALTGASLVNGQLTLSFVDPQNKTGGGSCRVAILWRQISATAMQFEGVRSVRFSPEELFQP